MLSHLKRRIGVVAAVAVLAALVPALSTSVASAAPLATPASAQSPSSYSACPASASIPSAGFTDTTSTDVDCIKYYGITQGATATTYDPTASVPRWQMALFLTRAATKMGVTLGDGSDQDFTDISGEAADIQTAINQLKQLGVTTGTTTTTYSPDDNVTREQMAMFLERLAGNVSAGSGGQSDDTTVTVTTINATDTGYNYSDIDSGVTFEGHNAIVEMYNLGVPGHAKTVTTFSPNGDIPRSEMATWLTNLAGHSHLRPSGLHLQANYNAGFGDMSGAAYSLLVSHRSDAFAATADTIVDVFGFTATTTADESGLASTGACKDALEVSTGTEELCLIENTDYVTDQNGDIEITQSAMANGVDVDEGESTQFWAWTAAVGTYFSSIQTASTTTVTSTADGPTLHVSVSHPLATTTNGDVADGFATNNYWDAPRGEDRTFTVQLRSVAAGATNTAAKNVSQAGCGISVSVYENTTFGGAITNITNSTLITDANGSATFTPDEPADTTAADAENGMSVVFSNFAYNGVAGTDYSSCATISAVTYDLNFDGAGTADTDGFSFSWDDDVPAAGTVTLTAAANYVTASATGTGATNTLTAVSYDNHGNVRANKEIGLMSWGIGAAAIDGIGDDVASTFTVTRTTNSSGAATFGLTRDDGDPAKEVFKVNDDALNLSAAATVIWTDAPSSVALDNDSAAGSAPTALVPGSAWSGAAVADDDVEAQIVRVDLANDTYVVEIAYYDEVAGAADTTFVAYTWDSNDFFHDGGVAYNQAMWEYLLSLDTITPAAGDDLYHATTNGTQSVQSSSNPSEYNRP